jgi:hypothetical protein
LPVFVDLVPDQTPWVFSGLVTDAVWLRSNRDAVKRFLRATIEGNYLAMTDAARAKETLARALKLTDRKVLDLAYDDFRQQSPPNAEISRDGALRNIAIVAPCSRARPEDYCDFSLAEELRAEGFFAAMQAKYGKL